MFFFIALLIVIFVVARIAPRESEEDAAIGFFVAKSAGVTTLLPNEHTVPEVTSMWSALFHLPAASRWVFSLPLR